MTNFSTLPAEVRLRNERAPVLRAALHNAFSAMECKKALASCDNDIARAANWLVAGNWRAGKLITWNSESLKTKSQQLSDQLCRPVSECREVLMNCSGHMELALRRLKGLPALDTPVE